MADVKFLLNCIYRNLFDKLYFISKLKHRTVHCSWHAVLLCFLPEQTSALTRKSTSTSTTALFTAISTEAVTPLAATCSAALVVLFCAYGTDLYTGLTRNILVLYSCTVYRLYSVYSTNALPGSPSCLEWKKKEEKMKVKLMALNLR